MPIFAVACAFSPVPFPAATMFPPLFSGALRSDRSLSQSVPKLISHGQRETSVYQPLTVDAIAHLHRNGYPREQGRDLAETPDVVLKVVPSHGAQLPALPPERHQADHHRREGHDNKEAPKHLKTAQNNTYRAAALFPLWYFGQLARAIALDKERRHADGRRDPHDGRVERDGRDGLVGWLVDAAQPCQQPEVFVYPVQPALEQGGHGNREAQEELEEALPPAVDGMQQAEEGDDERVELHEHEHLDLGDLEDCGPLPHAHQRRNG